VDAALGDAGAWSPDAVGRVESPIAGVAVALTADRVEESMYSTAMKSRVRKVVAGV